MLRCKRIDAGEGIRACRHVNMCAYSDHHFFGIRKCFGSLAGRCAPGLRSYSSICWVALPRFRRCCDTAAAPFRRAWSSLLELLTSSLPSLGLLTLPSFSLALPRRCKRPPDTGPFDGADSEAALEAAAVAAVSPATLLISSSAAFTASRAASCAADTCLTSVENTMYDLSFGA